MREGYTFAGWSFSPSGERNSIIATPQILTGLRLESYYRSLQYGENPASTSIYDIQLYAVWEKNVTELTDSDTNVSISWTDGVPEDATFPLILLRRKAYWKAVGAERGAAGPAVHLRHQRPPEWGNP